MISQNPSEQKPAAGTDPRPTEPSTDPNKIAKPGGEDAETEKRAKAQAEKATNEDG